MNLRHLDEASKLVAKLALELHSTKKKMLIDECIERAAWGVMFAFEVTQGNETNKLRP